MHRRCYETNNPAYASYGGRGIRVCERWHDISNFVKDIVSIPDGMSLDRINNDGDYSPENCRIATPRQQSNNTRANILICIDGTTKTLAQWVDVYDISYGTVHRRIQQGVSYVDALSKPLRRKQVITHNGETKTIREWADLIGTTYWNMYQRIYRRGWPIERALTEPVRK